MDLPAWPDFIPSFPLDSTVYQAAQTPALSLASLHSHIRSSQTDPTSTSADPQPPALATAKPQERDTLGRDDWRRMLALLMVAAILGVSPVWGERRQEPASRVRRSIPPCPAKFLGVTNHSACQPPSSKLTRSGVSVFDRSFIVERHNHIRANTTPSAEGMLRLSWDNELEQVAQAWADHCTFTHDRPEQRAIPGRLSVGQNIGQGYQDWNAALEAWLAEQTAFVYPGPGQAGQEVRHYTQMIWANTTLVGCGFAVCGDDNFHVCNYGPAGNVEGLPPFLSGHPCIHHGQACRLCDERQLCYCSDLTACENGAIFDPVSCACQCLETFYVGRRCELDCQLANDSQTWCTPANLHICGAVSIHCPLACNVCPYGDYRLSEKNSGSLQTAPAPVSLPLFLWAVADFLLSNL